MPKNLLTVHLLDGCVYVCDLSVYFSLTFSFFFIPPFHGMCLSSSLSLQVIVYICMSVVDIYSK